MWNKPSMSVMATLLVPTAEMVTPIKGSFASSVTSPVTCVIFTFCCTCATAGVSGGSATSMVNAHKKVEPAGSHERQNLNNCSFIISVIV